MGFFTITEDEAKDQRIPPDSKFTVVCFTPRGGSKHGYSEVVAKGRATGTIGLNLDPGTYRVCINSLGSRYEEDRTNWVREFTVGGNTPDEIKKLRRLKPRWAKGRQTSDGARWSCTFPGCHQTSTSEMGAALHEFEVHLGIDPLKSGRAEVKEALTKSLRQ